MLIVELSDHPGDLLTAARQRRAAADERTRTKHDREVQRIRQQRDDARNRRKWLTWLKLTVRLSRSGKSPSLHSVPTDTEEILKAGVAGEQRIARELGLRLNDDWTLFHGYRNARGEIDYLLLGPKGLWALEVKNINATVRIDRDSWLADKYDRYGNAVDHYPIADRRGRSPSQQLNQPADALTAFLRQRGQPTEVGRAVILIHPRSRLGQAVQPGGGQTVHVMVGTSDLLKLIAVSRTKLENTSQLKNLIEHDHKFHDRPRRSQRR
jgi:hypothetical protein